MGQLRARSSVFLCVALICVSLFFGLWPRGYDFSNHITWIPGQPGIRFIGYGIAYTAPIPEWGSEGAGATSSFSIELALTLESAHDGGFNFILAVYDGNKKNQLLVGQWRSWVIVMNGDDYDHKRKTRRIGIKFPDSPPARRFLTITTGRWGTRIYLDNRLIRAEKGLTLTVPKGDETRLLLGNAADGKNQWKGEIRGLAWYDYELDGPDVAQHFREWVRDRDFVFAGKYNPYFLYLFNEKDGWRVLDHAGGGHDLEIPSKMVILDKSILSLRGDPSKFSVDSILDPIINFIGFIPLGFVFMMCFVPRRGFLKKQDIVMAVSLCFGLSLTIEILQAWIPSRSSDCMDLFLNTFGALVGVMMYVWGYGRRGGWEEHG